MGIYRKRPEPAPPEIVRVATGTVRRSVLINVDPVRLAGDLVVPPDAIGTVVFAHGSGSDHRSPRNVLVAEELHRRGLGTLLFDLLTPEEAEDRELVFDVELLASRLEAAVRWLATWPIVGRLPIGFFGASTGAAGALVAAAHLRKRVAAVVSRGGRPDLAGQALQHVTAPTLLIVGGADPDVLELNRWAERTLRAAKRLEVVAGAGHLFEEPGALEHVSALAAAWFEGYLGEAAGRRTDPLASVLR